MVLPKVQNIAHSVTLFSNWCIFDYANGQNYASICTIYYHDVAPYRVALHGVSSYAVA